VEEEKSAELQADFYKSVLTFALAALGGEITLLQTLFVTAKARPLAYTAIALLVATCVFVSGAHEVLIRRICPRPTFSNRLLAKIASWEFASVEAEWVLSFIGGATFGLGIALFGLFVILA
jgi:hypothetical protein